MFTEETLVMSRDTLVLSIVYSCTHESY